MSKKKPMQMIALVLFSVMFALLCFSSCAKNEESKSVYTNENSANENSTEHIITSELALRAYKEKIAERICENVKALYPDEISYAFYDINGDGIDELMIDNGYRTETSDKGVEFYTYQNNHISLIGSSYDGWPSAFYDETLGDGKIKIVFVTKLRFYINEYDVSGNQLNITRVSDIHELTEEDEKWIDSLDGVIEFSYDYEAILNDGSIHLNNVKSGRESGIEWTYDSETACLSISSSGSFRYLDAWNRWSLEAKRIEIDINNEWDSIPDECFTHFSFLESVVINGEMKFLGNKCFFGCSNLKLIDIETITESIGQYCFYGTAYYNNQDNWIDGVLYLDNYIIDADPQLIKGKFTLPMNVTVVADYAFESCGITELVTSHNIYFGDYCFESNTELEKITIRGIPTFGENVFNACPNIKEITTEEYNGYIYVMNDFEANCFKGTVWYKNNYEIINGVSYIGNTIISVDENISGECRIKNGVTKFYCDLFCETKFTSLYIPASVDYIGFKEYEDEEIRVNHQTQRELYLNNTLESITVDKNNLVYSSQDGVLYDKDKTKILLYPDSKKTEHFVILDSVQYIGDNLGKNDCLKSVYIGSGVMAISTGTSGSGWVGAFFACQNLEFFEVSEKNQYFSSDECGVIYNKDKSVLMLYPMGRKSEYFTVPNSVKTIVDCAFIGSVYLEKLYIGTNVKAVEGSEPFPSDISQRRDGVIRSFEIRYAGSEESWKKISDIDSDYVKFNAKNFPANQPSTSKPEATTKRRGVFDFI